MAVIRVKLLNRHWDLDLGYSSASNWGACDRPDTPGKRILVHRDIQGQAFLDVLIHECLHAGLHPLDNEELVENLASDLTQIILLPEVMRRANLRLRKRTP